MSNACEYTGIRNALFNTPDDHAQVAVWGVMWVHLDQQCTVQHPRRPCPGGCVGCSWHKLRYCAMGIFGMGKWMFRQATHRHAIHPSESDSRSDSINTIQWLFPYWQGSWPLSMLVWELALHCEPDEGNLPKCYNCEMRWIIAVLMEESFWAILITVHETVFPISIHQHLRDGSSDVLFPLYEETRFRVSAANKIGAYGHRNNSANGRRFLAGD